MSSINTLNKDELPVKDKDKIIFFPQQVKYLRENFPTVVMGVNKTINEHNHYNGQQSVLAFVEERMR